MPTRNLTIVYSPLALSAAVTSIIAELTVLAEDQKKLGVYNFLHFVIDHLQMFAGAQVSPERLFHLMYDGLRSVPKPFNQEAEDFGFGPVLIRLLERELISREFANLFLQAGVKYERSLAYLQ